MRPRIILRAAVSLDGCIDDTSAHRLILSNEEDFAAGDAVRAEVDAVLIGAESIRRDDPSLTVKSATLQEQRVVRGKSRQPIKVTVTSSGQLDPKARFFSDKQVEKIVYCPKHIAQKLTERLNRAATVVAIPGSPCDVRIMAEDLGGRGIKNLLLEGGGILNAHLLQQKLIDKMQLSIAPFFVGEMSATKVIAPSISFPRGARSAKLDNVSKLGDMIVAHFSFTR